MVKWKRGRRSDDLIDRRGTRAPRIGTGGIPIPLGALRGLGVPGLIVVVGLVVFLNFFGGGTGVDPGVGPLDGSPDPADGDSSYPTSDPDAELVDFLSFVLDDIQDEWDELFRVSGLQYERAELVLFDGYTDSACGGATEAIGPHYCPVDRRVYLDLGFFRQLSEQFGAKGDFAQAYVLSHEIGHHVQNLLGTMEQVQQSIPSDDGNDLSIRLELQADCFAGIWGYSTFQRDLLESGDLQEALVAAAAVGDDRIQQSITGRVNPETWTHGSSDQRVEWYTRGFDEGDPQSCDTFSGAI